jgi:hypothetical protein
MGKNIVNFDLKEKALAEIEKNYGSMEIDLDDKKSVSDIVSSWQFVRGVRINIEKQAKEIRSKLHSQYQSQLDIVKEEEAGILPRLRKVEAHLKAERDKVEARKEEDRKKREAAAAEKIRLRNERLKKESAEREEAERKLKEEAEQKAKDEKARADKEEEKRLAAEKEVERLRLAPVVLNSLYLLSMVGRSTDESEQDERFPVLDNEPFHPEHQEKSEPYRKTVENLAGQASRFSEAAQKVGTVSADQASKALLSLSEIVARDENIDDLAQTAFDEFAEWNRSQPVPIDETDFEDGFKTGFRAAMFQIESKIDHLDNLLSAAIDENRETRTAATKANEKDEEKSSEAVA